MGDYNTQLRKRLRYLVEHFGQAEVARRTKTAPSTLSRYLRDTRIPAEFVARAVEALELRPSWLLHGEEPPFASTVTRKSEEMASNLLEIVRAMEATSRMRVGAVFGRSDLRKLDELNRALADLSELRQRLRKEFEEQYLALIDSTRKALNRSDFADAERLLRCAEVFSELCRDEDLRSWLRSCQAYYQIRRGAPEQAVRPHAQMLFWTLGELGSKTESVYQHAFNHVTLLVRLDRRPEALRLCRAFGALAEALPERSLWRVANRAQEAYLQLLSGNARDWLGPALAAMNELRSWPGFNALAGQHLAILYFTGMHGLKKYWDVVPLSVGAALRSLSITISLEDAEGLADVLELSVGEKEHQFKPGFGLAGLAKSMLARLRGGSAAAFRDSVLENAALLSEVGSQISPLHMQALMASCLRLGGNKRECLKTVREFFSGIEQGGGDIQPDVIAEAIQLRNLLLTTSKPAAKECQAARERLTELRRRGFHCLDRWAEEGLFDK